jgi:hypothetical protein
MSKFAEILAEFKSSPIEVKSKRAVEFFLKAKDKILQEQLATGKSIEEAKENLDYQLCQHKIERIKESKRRSEKFLEDFRQRGRDNDTDFINGQFLQIGTKEHFLALERIKLEAQEEAKTERMQNEGKEIGQKKQLTTRQAVMLLLTLMYGSPEVPNGINKSEVSNFIDSLKNIDSANIYKFVCNPTGAKAESIKERTARITDIQTVLGVLKSLNVNKGRWKGIEENTKAVLEKEIQNIKDLIQQDDEEKRNNR